MKDKKQQPKAYLLNLLEESGKIKDYLYVDGLGSWYMYNRII